MVSQIIILVSSACCFLLANVQLCWSRDDLYSSSQRSTTGEYLRGSHESQLPKSSSYLPSYDIIGLPESSNGFDAEKQLIKMLTSKSGSNNRSSSGETDFHRNLATLKKVVQAKKLASLGGGGGGGGGGRRVNDTMLLTRVAKDKRLMNSTLEDDINTINVLIGMLMLANRRLVEQRDKQQQQQLVVAATTTSRPQPMSQSNHLKRPREFHNMESASQVSKTTASLADRESSLHKKSRLTTNHRNATAKPSSGVFKVLEARKAAGGRLAAGESRQPHHLDHSLVRPGGYSMEASSMDKRHQDPLHNHKPMIARDLLQVERPDLAPENMFVSRPGSMSHRQALHEYLQRQQAGGGSENQFPQVGGEQERMGELGEEQQPPPGGSTTPGYEQPMVPPYNSWSLAPHHRLRPLMEPHQHQHLTTSSPSLKQQPPSMLFHEHLSLKPHPPPSPQQVTAGALLHHHNPNQLQVDPLQHMLAAAKSQQAAALEYERRRLEHELDLGRRQELARKQQQHQQELSRQHQQARLTPRPPPPPPSEAPRPAPAPKSPAPEDAADPNQLEEPPVQQQQQQPQPGEGGAGEQQGNEGGESEPSSEGEQDNGNSNSNNQEAKEAQRQAEEDPDMKQLAGFTGDDFTDLFPPGILSEAEIKEMRRDQEEQRQRQAQEEREKAQAEEEEQQPDQNNQQQQENQQQPEEQQQQSETPQVATNSSQVASQEPLATKALNESRPLGGHDQQKPTRYLPSLLQVATGGQQDPQAALNASARANKTRRSNDAPGEMLMASLLLSGPSAPSHERLHYQQQQQDEDQLQQQQQLPAATQTRQAAFDEPAISLEDYLAVSSNQQQVEAGHHQQLAASMGDDGQSSAAEPMEALASLGGPGKRHRRR